MDTKKSDTLDTSYKNAIIPASGAKRLSRVDTRTNSGSLVGHQTFGTSIAHKPGERSPYPHERE
ncbi:hypothetical protein KC949_02290 [Candidatus Saccharibacteria bacterium]|nr:hypothetical protein [Candidatus Saccharibacteria bacterium]